MVALVGELRWVFARSWGLTDQIGAWSGLGIVPKCDEMSFKCQIMDAEKVVFIGKNR